MSESGTSASEPEAGRDLPGLGELLRHPGLLLAFGFGSGLSAKAPGTCGTLAAIPLAFALLHTPLLNQVLVLVGSFLLGIWFCQMACDRMGVDDHGAIVWDEFVGYGVAVAGAPPSLMSLVLGFALFRIFDILKPWPISWFDRRLHGGLGVMLDDVLAGLASCLILHIIILNI